MMTADLLDPILAGVCQCSSPEEDATEWELLNSPHCEERVLVNSQGIDLAVFTWPPLAAPCRGVVVLYHGIDVNTRFEFLRHRSMLSDGAELGLQYDRSFIAALNAAGFLCVGADMQGYGASGRVDPESIAYFERFSDIERDALLVYEDAKARHPGLPTFLLGISYGGLVVASLAAFLDARGGADYVGAVLMCPAMSLEKIKAKPSNAIMLPISEQLSRYFPKIALGQKSVSHFPMLSVDDHSDDKTGVYTGKLRARVACETLAAVERARRLAPGVTSPLLLVHSRNDTMTDVEGSVHFHAHASSRDKTLVYADEAAGPDGDMWHGLTQDPGCEAIAERVCAWLLARVPR